MDSLFRDNVCIYFGIFTVITYCVSSRCVGITTVSIKATNVEWDFVVLESIPDILIILLSQLLVVIIFQKTGFMPVKLAGIGEERARLLPIICLTLPTTLLFIKLLLLRFREELEKDYSIFAKSKGLSLRHILTNHISRNVLLTTIYYAKTNILFMLSNLYIIEWIFNTYGMFVFVKENSKLEIFTVSLIILYVPLFILFRLLHTFLQNVIKERV